jgi:ribosomal-protein-alanine N-acetyltransferase
MTDRVAHSIRPMHFEDIPRVLQIATSLPHAPHWPVAAYEAALNPTSEPRRIALVAETQESETVVGFVVASLVAGEAELESIAVATEAQRSGFGGHLLNHLLARLKEREGSTINLEVRASNSAALALYARHCFKETGRRVGYYRDPVEDAVLMEHDLR